MDDFSQWPALITSLTALQQRVANPAVLLQPNPDVTAAARSAIKVRPQQLQVCSDDSRGLSAEAPGNKHA
jgi:hypothetical protein